MMPWLTNNFCALALALNSTGKVRKAKRDDEPKRMIPIQPARDLCPSDSTLGADLRILGKVEFDPPLRVQP
jgi:hypothetical protein